MGKLANRNRIIEEHISLLKVMGITANQAMEQLAGGSNIEIFNWDDVHYAIDEWYELQDQRRKAVNASNRVSQEGIVVPKQDYEKQRT